MNSTPSDVFAVYEYEDRPKISLTSDGRFIIVKSGDGTIHAFENTCLHQGNRFRLVDGERLVCPVHGWQLDPSDGGYKIPVGSRCVQEKLRVEKESSHRIKVFFSDSKNSNAAREMISKESLQYGEMNITHLNHACAIFKLGDYRIATDPWCVGPAFVRGWWLANPSPENWLEQLLLCDSIYISHSHSDHLNPHTLRHIVSKKPTILIIVPLFDSRSTYNRLVSMGFVNVIEVPFNQSLALSSQACLKIYPDAAGREDSGFLLEYKGHRILNTVDSQNLNAGLLPSVDVLMSSFASGASGFPVCWDYGREQILAIVEKKRIGVLNKVARNISACSPKVFIPFAGYFSESHPLDMEIKSLNKKNSPEDVSRFLAHKFDGLDVLAPKPGYVYDLTSTNFQNTGVSCPQENNFETYLNCIEDEVEGSFELISDIQEYFEWAGYSGDRLALYVTEVSDDFSDVKREFCVDFSGKNASIMDFSSVFDDSYRFLNMKVRSIVFRYVLLKKLPWDEISIGFNARFSRTPDVYNQGFWNHFQDCLPID